MDLDELTVRHRTAGTPVYRLAGCSQFYFAPPEDSGDSFDAVWRTVADSLAQLDEASHWIGPLDARPRAFDGSAAGGTLNQIRAVLERDWGTAVARFEAVTLRVFSTPDPPRQQCSLSLPASDSRERFAHLVTGERPSVFVQQPEQVVERVLRQARELRPHVGMIGFGLMSEPWMEPHHVESAWPYLERYPGLQLPYRLEWGADGAGIPNIDWLTVLGDRPLVLLGGPQQLRRRLDAAAAAFDATAPQVLEYEGGVIVRACEMPRLGDAAASGAPVEYRVVDAALRPLRWSGRSSGPSTLLKVREKANRITPAEATLRWAKRFE